MENNHTEDAKEVGEATTAMLMLMKNMGMDDIKSFSAACVVLVRIANSMKKQRQEMRRVFQMLAQEFPDGPVTKEEKMENLKRYGFREKTKPFQRKHW